MAAGGRGAPGRGAAGEGRAGEGAAKKPRAVWTGGLEGGCARAARRAGPGRATGKNSFMDGWVMPDEPEPCPPPLPSRGGRSGLPERLAPRAGDSAGADPAPPAELLATRPHGEAAPLPAAAVAGATEAEAASAEAASAAAAARRSLSRILAREAGRVARRAQAPPSPWTHPL